MQAHASLCTDGLSAPEAAQAWGDWMAQLFSGLSTDLYGDTCFDGQLHSYLLGDVVLTRLQGQRHRVMRSTRRLSLSEEPYLKIVAPWQGQAHIRQAQQQCAVGQGNWGIYDTSSAYEVASPQAAEFLIVMLPRHSLEQRGLSAEATQALMGRSLPAQMGISRLALQAMRNTYQELEHLSTPLAQRSGEMLVEMIHLSLLELSGQSTAVSQQQALHDRICAHVHSHLRHPGLSLASIASALNCSVRHLHNAFTGQSLSLGAYIQQERLALAMRELRNPQLAQHSISAIAQACGFSNHAHFSRSFKAQIGISPKDWRALANAGVPNYANCSSSPPCDR